MKTTHKFKRPYFDLICKRLNEPRNFIQIILGPRQSGKTTLIQQVTISLSITSHYISADSVSFNTQVWIEQQWEIVRLKLKKSKEKCFLLIFDEIQKISNWSEKIKKLWDEDTKNNVSIKVVLLGFSPLLIQKGLTETLTGRFELIKISHWSYTEMKKAFGFSFKQYIYFGGYPGSAPLINDEYRWKQYIKDSLIETTISKDILMMTRIDKPALLKRLFELGCLYSGQILSYNKILGQLQDAGNTTTLSHYLELLYLVGLLSGIQKFSLKKIKQKASSPKFQVLNNALLSSYLDLSYEEIIMTPELWGRLVESAVGAHLINITIGRNSKVFYWRECNREVDFVLIQGNKKIGIEVKSGTKKESLPGLELFFKKFKPDKVLLIGKDGIPIHEFLLMQLDDIL